MWRDEASSVTVDYQSEFPENSLRISKGKRGFVMDFRALHSGPFCGAGAELPEIVTIPYKSKRCTVVLPKHQGH
jgi:hypothetical protein